MKEEGIELSVRDRPEDWLSFHIFYHTGNRSELAVRMVRPVAAELLRRSLIESFFFVRYTLGAPHVRLRLLPRPGNRDAVRAWARQEIERFLERYPSPRPLPDEEIQKQNLRILGQEPNEWDDTIHADNSWRELPFIPEVERYGGPDLLSHSLLFFDLSSRRALELLGQRPESEPAWLATTLELLRRLALGFAMDTDELKRLTGIPPVAGQEVTTRIVAKADRVFEQSREIFLQQVRRDLEKLSLAATGVDDFEMATCLGRELQGLGAPARQRILTSHLHMTANRLGLRNGDEIYLSRLIGLSLATLESCEPQGFSELQRSLNRRASGAVGPAVRLRDLPRPTLTEQPLASAEEPWAP